jgi:hypothetical protein
MTKLTAVNRLLNAIKESPVNTLAAPLSEEAADAQNVLDEVSDSVQREEWTFNTDYGVSAIRDVNGKIDLGESILSVEFPRANRFTLRGTKVYDIITSSFALEADLTLIKVVRLLAWDDLPSVAQSYICYRAMRVYQDRLLGTKDGERPVTREESDAHMRLKREHSRQRRPNALTSPQVNEVAFRNQYTTDRESYLNWGN